MKNISCYNIHQCNVNTDGGCPCSPSLSYTAQSFCEIRFPNLEYSWAKKACVAWQINGCYLSDSLTITMQAK